MTFSCWRATVPKSRFKKLCLRLGLEGRVRFLGHREGIPQLLATCDLFVLPWLYEGLPLSASKQWRRASRSSPAK